MRIAITNQNLCGTTYSGQWLDGQLHIDLDDISSAFPRRGLRDEATRDRDSSEIRDLIESSVREGVGTTIGLQNIMALTGKVVLPDDMVAIWDFPMLTPTIHLGGTSEKTLIEQNRAVRVALGTAMDLMREARPHGRDFYTQHPEAITLANNDHLARMSKLQSVLDDLDEISRSLHEQAGRRGQRGQ